MKVLYCDRVPSNSLGGFSFRAWVYGSTCVGGAGAGAGVGIGMGAGAGSVSAAICT